MTEKNDKITRVDVPLRMIEGNIDAMLSGRIPCYGVSFRWAENTTVPTLVLMFHQSRADRMKAEAMGMKFVPISTEEF